MSEQLNYIQYLEQPKLISQADKELFHSWVNTYPYVPVFRVLLAARYQSEDHPDTAKYIEQAAFYVQDRKQLKQLLRTWQQIQYSATSTEDISPSPTEEIVPQEEVRAEETTIKVPEAEVKPELIPEYTKTSEEEILTENEEQELQQIIHESTTDTEEGTPETIISIEPLDEPVSNKSNEEEILIEGEREIDLTLPEIETTSVIVENKDLIIGEQTEVPDVSTSLETESPVEKDQNVVEIVSEEGISEDDDIAFLKAINKYEEASIPVITDEEWQLEAPQSFIPELSEDAVIDTGLVSSDISWLTPWIEEFQTPEISKKIVGSIQTPAVPANPTEMKVPTETLSKETEKIQSPALPQKEETSAEPPSPSGSHSFDEWLNILEQKKQHPEEAPVFDLPTPEVFKDVEISEEQAENELKPTTPETQGEGSVKRQAADSVSFKKDMATETLAKLYIRQGKIDLAISIYHQLIDKFPEKSSYFAGQINRLK